MNPKVTLQTNNGTIAQTHLVTQEHISAYCKTGIEAYLDHYTHLWKNGDPSPYFNQYYQPASVKTDLKNLDFIHGIISIEGERIGIFKLDLSRSHPEFFPGKTLFVEKLYLAKTATGCGLGTALMHQFYDWAQELNLKGIWLETMLKGPARNFYIQNGFQYLGSTAVPYPQVLEGERAMWIMGREL